MSLSSPTPPSPIPASSVADTQQGYNVAAGTESQAGSAVNQSNPYGSLTYTQSGTGPGGVPLYTATTQLSPQQQSLLNTLQGTQQTAENQAGNLLAGANYGATNPSTTIGNATSGLTGQLMQGYLSSVSPIYNQQVSQLDTQLRNQGISPQSNPTAYNAAMNPLLQSQYQAENSAAAQFEPSAYGQAVTSYELPLQTATSELGISQPGNVSSNLVNTPSLSIQPANYTGAVSTQEQMQEQEYQQQLQQQQAMMSGIFGLGSSALGGLASGTGLGGALGSGLKSLGGVIGNALIPSFTP